MRRADPLGTGYAVQRIALDNTPSQAPPKSMRKAVTFRFDQTVVELARQAAAADNRSFTNFVETAILRAIDVPMDNARSATAQSPTSPQTNGQKA